MRYTEQRMFDRFVHIAKEMGSRAWERITTMSDMAEMHQRQELALALYEAPLGPGIYERLLRKKHQKLRGRFGLTPTRFNRPGKREAASALATTQV